jgi:indole-3-glycerol phosphate synthase
VIPESELREQVLALPPTRGFAAAILARTAALRPAVIAEFKRASPSMGAIARQSDPAAVARQYEAAGAVCLSVLTDRDFFSGSAADLAAARSATALPVLRKDFIIDPYQIWESRAMGADAVLFIVDAVPIADFLEMEKLATTLGLDVLAETHTPAQFADALALATPLLGVNNRDLHTFDVDVARSTEMARLTPPGRCLVSESGISQRAQVETLQAAGVYAYLVGTSLIGSDNPQSAMRELFLAA